MLKSIKITNPLDHPDWNDLVTASKDYSFYHSSNWAKALHEAYDYKPLYFAVVEGRRLRTLIPIMEVKSAWTGLRGVSLPFTDYCEPIGEAEDFTPADVESLIEYGKSAGWKYIDFRGEKYFSREVPNMTGYFNHVLPLGDEDGMISGFHEHNWRNIRTAVKKGVAAEVSATLEAVREFYCLHCVTRKMHGVPPQPFSFFERIHDCIISKNLGTVVLASYMGKYIAGGVFLHLGNRSVYKYGASDRSFRSLCANNLVIWEAIRLYAAKGCRTMSFGRTDFSDEGLRKFKAGWGAEEKIIKYFRYDIDKGEFVSRAPSKNETARSIMRRMPVPLLRMAGSLVYRHMG